MSYLEAWLPAVALFLEALFLAWIGRFVAQVLARKNFNSELTDKDNPAAGLAVGGYALGLFLALSGLLVEGGDALAKNPWEGFLRDAAMVGLHGWIAMLCLLASAALWRPLLGLDLQKDVFQGRNVGAGLVCGSGLVATGLIYHGSIQGEGPFLSSIVFFALGQGALFATNLLYEKITPYNVQEEIGQKQNLAAAIGLSGTMIGAGIIVGHAASGDFTDWQDSTRGFFLFLIPLLALPLVRWFVANGILLGFKNVNAEISRDRNTAAGVMEAVAYVGTAIFLVRLV